MTATETDTTPTPSEDTPPPKPPKTVWRRAWGWIWKSMMGMLLAVIMIPFLLLLAWQIQPLRVGLKDIGLSVASNFLDGKLEVEDLGGDLITSLEIHKARWYRKDGKKDLMAGLDYLRVEYNLWHFLTKGELLVTKVHLKKPRGYLGMDEKGELDLVKHIKSSPEKKPKKKKKESTGETSFALRVEKVIIEGLEGSFRLNPKLNPYSLKTFSMEADYRLQVKGLDMASFVKSIKLEACISHKTFEGCKNDETPDLALNKLNLFFKMDSPNVDVKVPIKGSTKTKIVKQSRTMIGVKDMVFDSKIGTHSSLKMKVGFKQLDFAVVVDTIRTAIVKLMALQSPDEATIMKVLLPVFQKLKLDFNMERLYLHPDDVKTLASGLPVADSLKPTIAMARPPIDLSLQAAFSLKKIFTKLRLNAGKAKVSIDADGGNIKNQKYHFKLNVKDVNLKKLLRLKLPETQLGLTIDLQGKGYTNKTDATLLLAIHPGHFDKKYRFKSIRVQALANDGIARVKAFRVVTPFGRLAGKAKVNYLEGDFDAYVLGKFPRLRRIGALIQQKLRGSLTLQAWAKGKKWKPKARAEVKLANVSYSAPVDGKKRWRHRYYRKVAKKYQKLVKELETRGTMKLQRKPLPKTLRRIRVDGRCRGAFYAARRKARRSCLGVHMPGKPSKPTPLEFLRFCVSHYQGLSAANKVTPGPVARVRRLVLKTRLHKLAPLQATIDLQGRNIHAGGQHLRTLRLATWARADFSKQRIVTRFSRFSFNIGTGRFRLEGKPRILLTNFAQAQIKRLWWRNRSERIRIDGLFNWKRWRHNMDIRVKRLRLAPIRKVLKILPKSGLAGQVNVDVRVRGSFSYPRLKIKVGVNNVRFRQFHRLNTEVKLGYGWTRRERGVLSFSMFAEHRSRQGQLQRLAEMDLAIPARLNLHRVALQSNFCRLIQTRRPLKVDVRVPGLDLAWLGKKLKIKGLAGQFSSSIQMKQTLRNPKLDLEVKLKRAGFKQYSGFDTDLFVTYSKGALSLSRQGTLGSTPDKTRVAFRGRELLTLAGRLPFQLSVGEWRGMLSPNVALVDKPMGFEANFAKQQLGWLLKNLVPTLPPNIGFLNGWFDGKVRLNGRPTIPQVSVRFRLKDGSFCPFSDNGFACYEQVGFDEKAGQREYIFKTRNDITKTVQKARGLRVRGLNFDLGFQYNPPNKLRKTGRLTLNTLLAIGKTTLLAVGKHAKPKRRCQFGKEPASPGAKPVELAITMGLNPKSMAFNYELFDPIRLQIQVPKLRLQTIAKWVRLSVMEKIRGEFELDLSTCGRLSDPDVSFSTSVGKLSYIIGEDADAKPIAIDRSKLDVQLSIRAKNLGWNLQAWVLGKRLMESTAFIRGINIGLNPKTLQLTRKQMGHYVYANVLFPGFDLNELATRIGLRDKLYGLIKGNLEIAGDPACPMMGKPPKGRKIRNYLTIENGYVGMPRKLYRRLRKQGKPASQLAALEFRRLQIALSSIAKGRLQVMLGLWRKGDPDKVPPDTLQGNIKWPMPLVILPVAAKSLVEQKRCKHWPNGKPSQKVWVDVSRNTYVLSLRFLEAFVPGLLFDVILDLSVHAEGTTKALEKLRGYLHFRVKNIAMKEYGLELGTNLSSSSPLRKKNYRLWQRCRSIRDTKNRNKKDGIYDMHIKGCMYSYLKFALEPNEYSVEGRLQGRRGEPLLIYGGLPRKQFVPDISPPSECQSQNSDAFYTQRCMKARAIQSKKRLAFFVRSNNFRPMNTPQHNLILTTKIDILKRWNTALRILGSIKIPDMLFTLPESSRSATNYSDHKDMVVLGEKSETRLRPSQLTEEQLAQKRKKERLKKLKKRRRIRFRRSRPGLVADLKIVIPRGIRVRNRDLDFTARTEEFRDLQVKLSGDVLRLVGGVEVVRGEITFYTKKFTVQSGSRVTFMGQALSFDELGQLNARLNITAAHKITTGRGSSLYKKGHARVNVFLVVTGTIQKPIVDLQVKDAGTDQRINLDKANVLTLILTGSTTDDLAGGQQSGLSDQALGAFSKFASSQIRDSISKVVPIDVLKIETGARVEDLKIEVGKYFTKRLYGQILFKPVPIEEEDMWEVLLNVAVSRRWSLEIKFGQRKRNNALLLRGSSHFFYRIKR